MTLVAADVLKAPVGHELCVELAHEPFESVARWTERQFYAELVQAALRVSTRSESTLVAWTESELLPSAELVASRMNGGWFAQEELTAPQAWLSNSKQARAPTVTSVSTGRLRHKPHGALWTSSFLSDGSSGWDPMLESGYLGDTPYRYRWALFFDPSAVRVCMIDGPARYTALCDRYPRRAVDRTVSVDWALAARELDAVHLTPRGLLLAQAVTAPSQHGLCRLEGWDAECTAWFRLPPSCRLDERTELLPSTLE